MKKMRFAAIGLAHNHIYDMCRKLVDARAEQLIANASIDLIACAVIPCDRAELAMSQAHIFKATALSILAQQAAKKIV
ncbi:hypothetical protein [Pectobacterium quasiaquaticum]|nr:hypothetical protein [Pectobacterium quasiaquaticum]